MANIAQCKTIPALGFLRLPEVLEIIPIGKSSWWSGVKTGRYPKPVKLGPRTTAWRASDIEALVADLSGSSDSPAEEKLESNHE